MGRHVRLERTLETWSSGQGQRGHRRAVIGLGWGDDLPPLRLAAIDVVSARDLHCHLIGFGAARDESNTREAVRGKARELPSEVLLGRVGEPFVVYVSKLFSLRPRHRDDVSPPMAECCGHRAAAHGVEVAPARSVLHPDAIASNEDRIAPAELQRQDVRRLAYDHRFPGSGHPRLPLQDAVHAGQYGLEVGRYYHCKGPHIGPFVGGAAPGG